MHVSSPFCCSDEVMEPILIGHQTGEDQGGIEVEKSEMYLSLETSPTAKKGKRKVTVTV